MNDTERGAEIARSSVLIGRIPSGDVDNDGFPKWVEHIFQVRSGGRLTSPYAVRVRIETQVADATGVAPLTSLEQAARRVLGAIFSVSMDEAITLL